MTTLLKTQARRIAQPLMTSLEKCVTPYLEGGLILAVSGGPDSRALLEAFALWPRRIHKKIIVLSIDHQQRWQSEHESRLVLARAKRLGFTSFLETLGKKCHSSEHKMREKRLNLFKKYSEKFNCASIVLAHHKNDNSEGYLMSALGVGGGPSGAAIRPVENFSGLNLLRPFLSLEKKQLLAFLTLYQQTDFAFDNHNEESKGYRAIVRNFAMGFLSQLSPNLEKRLADLAEDSRRTRDFLRDLTANNFPLACEDEERVEIDLRQISDLGVFEEIIKQTLKKMCPNFDLRASRSVLTKLIHNFEDYQSKERLKKLGLDQSAFSFNLNQLEKRREYFFPGAKAFSQANKIVIKRL